MEKKEEHGNYYVLIAKYILDNKFLSAIFFVALSRGKKTNQPKKKKIQLTSIHF